MIKRYMKVSGQVGLLVLLACFIFWASTSEKFFKDQQDVSKAGQESISKLKENLQEIERISSENPNDPEVLRGAADLFRMLGYKYMDRAVIEYRKALVLNPRAEHLHTGIIGVHVSNYDGKDNEEDKESTLNVLMKDARRAEELWPENALYNYAKAYVFLEQGKEEEAKGEIQKALDKPYMRQYRESMNNAKDKVLTLLGFPLRLKVSINPSFDAGSFMPMRSCAEYLNTLAEDFLKERKFKDAVELYNGSIKIFTHLDEDASVLHAVYQKDMYDIYEKIHKCYEKQGLQEEARSILQEMEKIESKRVISVQRIEEFQNFLITADVREIEEEYQRRLEQGWVKK